MAQILFNGNKKGPRLLVDRDLHVDVMCFSDPLIKGKFLSRSSFWIGAKTQSNKEFQPRG